MLVSHYINWKYCYKILRALSKIVIVEIMCSLYFLFYTDQTKRCKKITYINECNWPGTDWSPCPPVKGADAPFSRWCFAPLIQSDPFYLGAHINSNSCTKYRGFVYESWLINRMVEKEGNVYYHKEIKATPKEFSGTKTFAFCVCKRLREKRRKPVEYPRGGGGGV